MIFIAIQTSRLGFLSEPGVSRFPVRRSETRPAFASFCASTSGMNGR